VRDNIDVRGLHIDEARRRVEKRFRDLLNEGGLRLRVKVGDSTSPISQSFIMKENLLRTMAE
jgi:hypothetical protein